MVGFQEIEGVNVFGPLESENVIKQIKACTEKSSLASALMGDHHLGYSMPVGGVVAYQDFISPSGVGFDIACGCKAVRLDMKSKHVKTNIKKTMDKIFSTISFGVGRVNEETVEHDLFDDPAWQKLSNVLREMGFNKDKARSQLGTVGSGNHYVDVFEDQDENVWVGVHFGSRGLGHKLASYFITAGGGKDGIYEPPVLLHERSDLGEQYIMAMELAGKYAYAGRDWVCSRVAKLLTTSILEEVHNHHNFAWKEKHDNPLTGELTDVWVVRKGATPAFPGQRGFVGGSMGDNSVILEGVDSELSKKALYSTVHGAGRVMGRMEAAGKFKWVRTEEGKPKQLVQTRPGKVSKEMMDKWVNDFGVELRGAGCDESPHCYKRLDEVLKHHEGTVKVTHTLRPLGVAMAPKDSFDPYKD